MMKKEIIAWPVYLELCDQIAHDANKMDKFDAVVCLARGGLIPAQIIAQQLDIREVYSLGVCSYSDDSNTQAHFVLYQPLTIPMRNKRVLIVDDIADSGDTFRFAKNQISNIGSTDIKTASVYWRSTSAFKPDIIGEEILTDNWLVMPYD